MTGLRMLQVLLAMMLFSTILITVYDGLGSRNVDIYRVMILQQGHKLADRYLQMIQAELLANLKTFDEVHLFYNPAKNDSVELYNENYFINIVSNYCDDSGDITHPDSAFQRIDIRIRTHPAMVADTLFIGTAVNPVNRVFADMY